MIIVHSSDVIPHLPDCIYASIIVNHIHGEINDTVTTIDIDTSEIVGLLYLVAHFVVSGLYLIALEQEGITFLDIHTHIVSGRAVGGVEGQRDDAVATGFVLQGDNGLVGGQTGGNSVGLAAAEELLTVFQSSGYIAVSGVTVAEGDDEFLTGERIIVLAIAHRFGNLLTSEQEDSVCIHFYFSYRGIVRLNGEDEVNGAVTTGGVGVRQNDILFHFNFVIGVVGGIDFLALEVPPEDAAVLSGDAPVPEADPGGRFVRFFFCL